MQRPASRRATFKGHIDFFQWMTEEPEEATTENVKIHFESLQQLKSVLMKRWWSHTEISSVKLWAPHLHLTSTDMNH